MEADTPVTGERFDDPHEFVADRVKIDVVALDLDAARGDDGDVEQVVHESEETGATPRDHA